MSFRFRPVLCSTSCSLAKKSLISISSQNMRCSSTMTTLECSVEDGLPVGKVSKATPFGKGKTKRIQTHPRFLMLSKAWTKSSTWFIQTTQPSPTQLKFQSKGKSTSKVSDPWGKTWTPKTPSSSQLSANHLMLKWSEMLTSPTVKINPFSEVMDASGGQAPTLPTTSQSHLRSLLINLKRTWLITSEIKIKTFLWSQFWFLADPWSSMTS